MFDYGLIVTSDAPGPTRLSSGRNGHGTKEGLNVELQRTNFLYFAFPFSVGLRERAPERKLVVTTYKRGAEPFALVAYCEGRRVKIFKCEWVVGPVVCDSLAGSSEVWIGVLRMLLTLALVLFTCLDGTLPLPRVDWAVNGTPGKT